MPKASRISTVTSRGTASIPAVLRHELHLKQGSRLLWTVVGDRELKVTVLPEQPVRGARGMLGFARRFREPRAAAAQMKELREGEEP